MQWEQFEKFIEEVMEKEQIPGVAVALSKNGQPIYERGFGTRNFETNEPVTPETIFGIASITKSFTALAIMKLAEEGRLQVEDTVIEHLPEFQLVDYADMEDIKIRHLLSHTTGLATMERKEQLTKFDEHLHYLNEKAWSWVGKPGEYMCYNNDMFLLLGAIIEKITGENYQAYINNQIINPLQMTRTTYNLLGLQSFENVTTPYVLEDGKPVACPWPTLGNYAVGGGIRSTVVDLLKYGNIYVDVLERNIVSRAYTSQMAQPVHQTNGKSFYGFALQTTPNYSAVTLVEHGGGQPGVSSNFGFIPEKGIVAVVLANMSGVSADAIWLAAVNTALGIPIDQKRNTEPEFEMTKEQKQRVLGTYISAEGSQVDISLEDQTVMATIDNKTYTLRASNETTLIIMPLEKPIRFFIDEKNDAWALFIGLRMLVKSR
ncbi:serine hydrolase domain-containing protein [Sporosarcina sp. FSL K6-1540]|uniref:serine hydrolase domain-containing protein n=1 Tax=Sporosarcina TaxID=1569 RepID=UPI00164EA879|nr:serine hydrolase domain-containing protein [Sporosarcina sp. resist]QNK90635.1 beta-lactamase family protein [Sporosarcina sp. resist]